MLPLLLPSPQLFFCRSPHTPCTTALCTGFPPSSPCLSLRTFYLMTVRVTQTLRRRRRRRRRGGGGVKTRRRGRAAPPPRRGDLYPHPPRWLVTGGGGGAHCSSSSSSSSSNSKQRGATRARGHRSPVTPSKIGFLGSWCVTLELRNTSRKPRTLPRGCGRAWILCASHRVDGLNRKGPALFLILKFYYKKPW